MLNKEKYVDGLTEAEAEDMAIIVNKTINEICLFSDKHNFERDNMLKYCAGLISTLAEVSTIQDFEVEKPQTNADWIRNMTDEKLAKWFDAVTKDVLGGSTWDKNGWLKWLQAETEGEHGE